MRITLDSTGKLVISEKAPARSAEDVPDAPYFGADAAADDETDEIPGSKPEPQTVRRAGRGPVVTTAIRQEAPAAKPAYRPAFVPLASTVPQPHPPAAGGCIGYCGWVCSETQGVR